MANTLFAAEAINTTTPFVSPSIETGANGKFELAYDIVSTGTPTTVELQVQVSQNDTDWFDFVKAPFGSLVFEDTQTASPGIQESIGEQHGAYAYIRLVVTGVGVDGSNYFTLSSELALYEAINAL